MRKLIFYFMGLAILIGLAVCQAYQSKDASINKNDSSVEAFKVKVDSVVIDNNSIKVDSFVVSQDSGESGNEKDSIYMDQEMELKKDPYTFRTLDQIEFLVPHAADSIDKALREFSAEYHKWYYYLAINSDEPDKLILVGSPGERHLFPSIDHLEKRIGYITVDGKCVDLLIRGGLERFKPLFKKTGQKNTFKYRTDYEIIYDNCVEYWLGITEEGLLLNKKIEKW